MARTCGMRRRLRGAAVVPAALLVLAAPLGPEAGAALAAAPPPVAQAPEPSTPARTSPRPDPGPIVPKGDPLGKIGIVAMVVAGAAGLWIYRVIRKGL